jgi:hypothetical protein
MDDDSAMVIEQCAQIADSAAAELSAILSSPRSQKSHYDKQTRIRLRYAIRWCRRIAVQIRALSTRQTAGAPNGDRLASALEALITIRPLIASSRESKWKTEMLQRIDKLTQPR